MSLRVWSAETVVDLLGWLREAPDILKRGPRGSRRIACSGGADAEIAGSGCPTADAPFGAKRLPRKFC